MHATTLCAVHCAKLLAEQVILNLTKVPFLDDTLFFHGQYFSTSLLHFDIQYLMLQIIEQSHTWLWIFKATLYYCIALHCFIKLGLHCIVLWGTFALHCLVFCCHCIALHCIVLYCIVLDCIALHCTSALQLHPTSTTTTATAAHGANMQLTSYTQYQIF